MSSVTLQRVSVVVVVGLVLVAAVARADQCALVDRAVATRAARAISESRGRLLVHCTPCGDGAPVLASAFLPSSTTATSDSVLVDGTMRDLAYLYLEVSPNVFENVALRTGCPADGVPEVWDFTTGSARPAAFGPVPRALARFGWGLNGAGTVVRPMPPG